MYESKKNFLRCLLVAWSCIFTFFLAQGLQAPVLAQTTRVVEVEGVGNWGGDEEKARLAAINDAKWRAVRQVNPRADMNRVNDYVQSYRVIGGGDRAGSRYMVRVAVTVRSTPDSQIDRKLIRWSGNPRIMVVVPETSFLRRPVPDPAAETEIIRNLVKAGFRVLESSLVAQFRNTSEMGRIIKTADVAAMRRLGAKYQCDILIVGEAFSETVDSPVNGYRAAEARVEVKAFAVDTGEIFGANGDHAGGSALSESIAHKDALKKAGSLLGEDMVTAIRDKMTVGARTVSVRLTGVTSASQLYNIQAAINKIAGVSSVQRRNYVADRKVANLDVETSLLTDQLSRQLERIQRPRIVITSSTGQAIQARIAAR